MQPITTEVDNIIETKIQTNENFVLNMDPLGLAQQYGFHTEVIDFTSDDYKVTKSGENGVYQHISSNDLYGFLYTLPIDPCKTIFNKDTLFARTEPCSTIGLQIFPISGYR